MDFVTLINEPRIQRILTHPETDGSDWRDALARFLAADVRLTRQSAGEPTIRALQRLMIFLGYSTCANGACAIDGDFGRGTNRGIAQFQHEQQLDPTLERQTLCYPCQWNSAQRRITAIPDVALDPTTLLAMLIIAHQRCEQGLVLGGDLETALFHLNALHDNRFLDCKAIQARYGEAAMAASNRVRDEQGITVRPEWLLAIIRQETAGVIRPRFEQHYLSRLNTAHPDTPLAELRMRSMSQGLGQIMGANFRAVGAPDATALFTAPILMQLVYVARFLKPRQQQTKQSAPSEADFRAVARYYNGPKYAAHHYHEGLARWFREFRLLG